MGWLSDNFDFEKFNAKHMFGQLRDDPERLFLGAADPFSSKMWGKILGKDYDPIVDQMGGATEGAYDAAEREGIDTGAAKNTHDIAHVVSALFAGNYGAGQLGGMSGGGGMSSLFGGGGGTGTAAGAGGAGGSAAGNMNWMKLAGSMMNGMGGGMGGGSQPEMVGNMPLENTAPALPPQYEDKVYQVAPNYNPYVQGLLNLGVK